MAAFNTYTKNFSGLRLGASLRSPNDNVFINVSWYKSTNPWYPNDLFNRHQISFYGGAKIPVLSLDVMAETDFNIVERKMLFTAVSVVYHYQCLDLKANVSIFTFREKPEIQYKISFGLGNIGTGDGGVLAPYGTPGGGSGGPRTRFYGSQANAIKIVYILDHSGSMVDDFSFLQEEVAKSVGGLLRCRRSP